MAEDLTLDLWTYDVGIGAGSPEAYAEWMVDRVTDSWDNGADIVLLPEFLWMGLEPLVAGARIPSSLHLVAHEVWHKLLPGMKRRLLRPDKAVVLGTAPFVDEDTGLIYNRAPIFAAGRALHQDKLHLTPWEKDFSAGQALHIWQFRGLRIAVIICLDIEIPELAARLRGQEIDLILCPSATETILGVERVDRCASARAVELGCYVGVSHLLGRIESELIDENIGRLGFYHPSQAAFHKEPRWTETEVVDSGHQILRVTVSPHALAVTRRLRAETNPATLGREAAGFERPIQLVSHEL
jgi:predicted amidohydrolase